MGIITRCEPKPIDPSPVHFPSSQLDDYVGPLNWKTFDRDGLIPCFKSNIDKDKVHESSYNKDQEGIRLEV